MSVRIGSFWFMAVVAVVTAVLFGLAPALMTRLRVDNGCR